MSILIVYCHPSRKSYTFEVLEQLCSVLEKEGLDYVISDLYAKDFKADMSAEEYEREGLSNFDLPLPQDVLEEQRLIKQAICIIFLYPVWWSDCPAKLKGWFDRVYSVGYAYGVNVTEGQELMKIMKAGVVICTAGYSNDFLEEIGIAASMRNVMLDDRLGRRFREKEMIILGGTSEWENRGKGHHQKLTKIARKLKKYFT